MCRWLLVPALVFLLPFRVDASTKVLNQSASSDVSIGNSLPCLSGSATAETSIYRRFHLADFGVSGPFNVASVTFGVERAAGGADGRQSVSVRLYNTGNLAALGVPVVAVTADISDQLGSLVTVPIPGSIISGDLTVEVLSPDGAAAGDYFLIGSNSSPQTAPGFIRAPSCGIAAPTDLAAAGAAGMHVVMMVTGTYGVSCEVQLSDTAYGNGDIVTVSDLRLANGVPDSTLVEMKIWLGVPGATSVPIANLGADGSLALPGSLDARTGPFALFAVTAGVPRGVYQFGCRLLEPVTGAALWASVQSFVVQ